MKLGCPSSRVGSNVKRMVAHVAALSFRSPTPFRFGGVGVRNTFDTQMYMYLLLLPVPPRTTATAQERCSLKVRCKTTPPGWNEFSRFVYQSQPQLLTSILVIITW